MNSIQNLEKYTNGMKKSLIDKIFFIDKVPDEYSMLDYGCATGTLIDFLSKLFTNSHYIGYDNNALMIDEASKAMISGVFTDNYYIAHRYIQESPHKHKILNLSSVIHEVYSYCSYDDIVSFWQNHVFNNDFSHIIIRDMIPSNTVNRPTYVNDVKKICKNANQALLADFENKWGSIKNLKNLMHFLLKYRYTENWEREVRENYLPITVEDLYKLIPDNYNITYQEHYCLPFLHDVIKRDFNIEFNEPTHFKMILERV